MKTSLSRHSHITERFILMVFAICALAYNITGQTKSVKTTQLNIDSNTDYLCYYGLWDEETIFRAKDFDMIILEPSNITAGQIRSLKSGHDNVPGTNDDVTVIGYLSIGEDHQNNRTGDGRGPCYYNFDSSKIVYEDKGLASWYVDDKDKDGIPDADPVWKSAYVNAGDSLWWSFLKTNPNGADVILNEKKCDGLFFDLLDTASPWYPWPYRWTVVGMSELVRFLRNTYPEKYLIANRGLFYFDPSLSTAYAHNVRPYIDCDMFESYYIETDRQSWAKKVNTEALKPDGFKVIALDYIDSADTNKISAQTKEVASYNWGNFISSMSLNEIRYDVFHRHAVDKNPPTWNNQIGVHSAVAKDRAVKLSWGALTDQSMPLKFDIYYTKDAAFSFASARVISNIKPDYNALTSTYSYTINELMNYSEYHFLIRVTDALGNSEHNMKVISATPPYSGNRGFIIDGSFEDWESTAKLNASPNPEALPGSALNPNADYVNFWAANDSANLFISYQVAGTISPAIFYHVFIDADYDKSTGYVYNDSSSIGADLMIESNYLYKYTGTGRNNWSWASAGGFQKTDAAGRTEMKIPFNALPLNVLKDRIRMFFNANNGSAPYNNLEIEPADYKNVSYSFKLDRATHLEDIKNQDNFYLLKNYPNPFNSSTKIQFQVPELTHVRLQLYNSLGEKILDLIDNTLDKGSYSCSLSSSNISSGIYFLFMSCNEKTFTRKMVVLK